MRGPAALVGLRRQQIADGGGKPLVVRIVGHHKGIVGERLLVSGEVSVDSACAEDEDVQRMRVLTVGKFRDEVTKIALMQFIEALAEVGVAKFEDDVRVRNGELEGSVIGAEMLLYQQAAEYGWIQASPRR